MMLPLEPCQGTQWSGSVGDELVGSLGGVCGGVGRCTQATMHHQSNRPNNQAGHSKCYVNCTTRVTHAQCVCSKVLAEPKQCGGTTLQSGVPISAKWVCLKHGTKLTRV